jgi:hypothetical protein
MLSSMLAGVCWRRKGGVFGNPSSCATRIDPVGTHIEGEPRSGCGSHSGQIHENLIEQAVEMLPNAEVRFPDQFVEVGKAMAEHLAMLQRTVDRLGGGKAVDDAAVEPAIAEGASRTELAAHGAIWKSLDLDVPAVVIGGIRYTRVGRWERAYHTMIGSVSVEQSLYRQSGERGGQPGGRVLMRVACGQEWWGTGGCRGRRG